MKMDNRPALIAPSSSSWKRRTSLEKILLATCLLVAVLAVVSVIVTVALTGVFSGVELESSRDQQHQVAIKSHEPRERARRATETEAEEEAAASGKRLSSLNVKVNIAAENMQIVERPPNSGRDRDMRLELNTDQDEEQLQQSLLKLDRRHDRRHHRHRRSGLKLGRDGSPQQVPSTFQGHHRSDPSAHNVHPKHINEGTRKLRHGQDAETNKKRENAKRRRWGKTSGERGDRRADDEESGLKNANRHRLMKRQTSCQRCRHKQTTLSSVRRGFVPLVSRRIIANFTKTAKVSKSHNDVCLTPDCVKTAARILESIDDRVEPCNDFFEYACGSWNRQNPIPDDKPNYNTFRKLNDELLSQLKELLEVPVKGEDIDAVIDAKNLYMSCLNMSIIEERRDSPLKVLLEEFGGWPVLNPNWSASDFDLTRILAKMKLFCHPVLLTNWVNSDEKDSGVNIIQIDQGGLGMPSREYFLWGRDDKTLRIYERFAVNMAKAMGADDALAEREMPQIVDFEIELANITMPEELKRDTEATYTRFKLRDLYENLTDEIDWVEYFNILFSLTNITIHEDEDVVVYATDYLRNLGQLIKRTPKRILVNYIIWSMVRIHSNNLPQKFLDLRRDINRAIHGTEQESSRWRVCVNHVNDILGMAVGRMFVQKHFDERAKDPATVMIQNIREVFRERLQQITWLDEATIKVAQKKVDTIRENIGYPEYIINATALNQEYEEIHSDPELYFENVLNILQISALSNIRQLRLPVDRDKWSAAPTTINAFYHAARNQILFPAAILHPPFYHENYPMSLNFGGIGMVIGHEITHGFDDKGRKYDKDGNLRLWWSPKDIANFKEKAQCIVDQYSNYSIPSIAIKLNGRQTQGENIADNGGLKHAFRAYKKWVELHGEEPLLPGLNLTHDQLFFVNFAHVWCGKQRPESYVQTMRSGKHCPGEIRVTGTVSNSYEFAKAFNCPLGSPMNPVKKCVVW